MSDVPLPEPPAAGRPGFLHRIQPVLALVIALAAVGLTFWEGTENRRHNRLSVKPRLAAEIESGRDSATEYVRMAIEGTGLGPAVINTFRIYFDGIPQDTVTTAANNPWQQVIAAVFDSTTQGNAHALGQGYYFPAGRRYVLFEAERPRTAPGSARAPLAGILERLAIQVCYCSVYGTDCDEVLVAAAPLNARACR